MKKIVKFVSLLWALIYLSSCKPKTPEQVAEQFVTSFHNLEYDKAKRLATETTAKQLDMYAQLASTVPESDRKPGSKVGIIMGEGKVDGEKAVYYYKPSDNPVPHKVNLVKENGEWRVQWNKTESMTVEEQPKAPTMEQENAPGEEIKIDIGQ